MAMRFDEANPLLWFTLALATALSVATGDALTKKFFGRFSALEMAVVASLFSLPFVLITLPFIPIPELDRVFWQTVSILVPLDSFAFYLYMKAIRVSPLSLSIPFLSFTPVFMIFTGFFILKEVPNLFGGLGIGCVVIGSYVLHGTEVKHGYLAPFQAILKEPGSILMLIVSLIYSLLAVLGKKAIQHSSPLFFGFFFLGAFDLVTLVFFPLFGKIRWGALLRMPNKGICVGLLLYVHVLCHVMAISMVKAVYMISVKRMSVLFSVVYGWLLFKESEISNRMLGALLMFLGVVCIYLLG
ncbi:MAG: DMT family transporter [Deltaproteobacteria bacterium]|nr:DMT family transporter [Deltaproteobacteria bacterium]